MSPIARVALSLLVAAALTALVFAWGGLTFTDLVATLQRLSFRTWLTAFGLHVLLYVLRAWRFAVLFPRERSVPPLPFLSVCAAHTLAAFVVPAKLGEATFVLYSGRICAIPSGEAIAALVVSRLLDLAVLALGFGIASIVLHSAGAWPELTWLLPLGLGLLLTSLLLFALSARGDLLVRGVSAVARTLGLDRMPLGVRLLAKADETSSALRRAGGRGPLFTAALISLPIWLSVFLFCAVLARGLGLPDDLSLAAASFGASLAILTSLLPVSAFANFGTLELGWVLGFGVLGVPRELAAATGLGLHAVQLAHVIALGALGHLGMALARPQNTPADSSTGSAG